MPSIIFYILKLSVALAVVYIFYLLVLRRLTFYNWNRWYLLGYTILAFLIPFINIAPILQNNEWSDIRVINWIPAIIENDSLQNIRGNAATNLSAWNIVSPVFFSGMLFLLARLAIQFISFYRMKKKAKPFTENGLTIYQVNENIIPFSFGSSIFINDQLHSEEELREIIRHEFVHVKQNHSLDIIWGELLCLLNWYNPFAWLLKRSIRQNLEFIADNKVVQNGIDKKEYQYLLLKVIGNKQYSIATQFNFSSLKRRIAMMNKTKSAKRQLLRMLFLLPATAVLLLAFRSNINTENKSKITGKHLPAFIINIKDTVPKSEPNGLYASTSKSPQSFILPIPEGVAKGISIDKNNLVTVELKDGSIEKYDLNKGKQKGIFEKKYGTLQKPVGKDEKKLIQSGAVSTYHSTAKNYSYNGEASTLRENLLNDNVQILAEISNHATVKELNQLREQLKIKGYDLQLSNTKFQNGKLTFVQGQISNNNESRQFSASNFSKMAILEIRTENGDKKLRLSVIGGAIRI